MDVSAKSLLETETNNQSYLQPQQALYQNFSKIKKIENHNWYKKTMNLSPPGDKYSII